MGEPLLVSEAIDNRKSAIVNPRRAVMLSRRREQILILGALISLNILLGWFLGLVWKEYRTRTQWLSGVPAAQYGLPRARGSDQARQPQSFVEIVDRDVFSPLRGVPPPQPTEELKAPKLPILFGTMDLGSGRFALMSPADQAPLVSKRVLPGEEIGGYKLLTVGASNVVLEWQEKTTTLEITQPASRSSSLAERGTAARPPAGAPPASAPGTMNTVGSTAASAAASLAPPGAPPNAPLGTIVGGKKKVLLPTPFGTLEMWQDVSPTGSQPPPTAPPK